MPVLNLQKVEIYRKGKKRNNDDLAGALKVGKKSISKHLKILEGKGIVGREKQGKNVYNWLTDNGKIAASLMEK